MSHRFPALICALFVTACSARQAGPPRTPSTGNNPGQVSNPAPNQPAAVGRTAESGVSSTSAGARETGLRWVENAMASLTLEEKAAQLVMPFVLGDFAPVGSSSHSRITSYVEDLKVGGVIMSVGQPTEVAAKLNALQEVADVPLLVAADLETGAGFRLHGAVQMPGTISLGGATDFPALMALGAADAEELAYEMGRITAVEARAVGIHVAFAPVLDVNNNPDNPIINVRSFGDDPERVARLGSAFVRGVEDHGAVATGKHFPGHGDTDTDSHLSLPVISHTRERMETVELVPFQAAVDAGMGAVMTAHIAIPALSEGVRAPVTLAPQVLEDLLRRDMGFDGLVFTDAMDMGAITRLHRGGEAAVRALEAGSDIILMPPSPEAAIAGIAQAVTSGRMSEERLDASVRRVLGLKARLGLERVATVDIGEVAARVGIPEHDEVARAIAERSITVLKNVEDGREMLPLLGTPTARVTSVTFRRSSDVMAGRYFNRRLGQTYRRLATVNIDADATAADYGALRRQVANQSLVIVSTYVAAVSYSGTVALPDETVEFIHHLRESGKPHILVSFGNPYLVTEFPQVRAYVLAWSGARVNQVAAARALLGEIEVVGRTPTAIPPLYSTGDGVMIPAKGSRER